MKIDFNNMTASAPNSAFAELMGGGKKDIQQLPIDELKPYPNQPFRPYTHDKLLELADDIAMNGIISPVIVRELNGAYQILAGHNRVSAAKIAKLDTVPCIIKDVNDDEANLILVNTNLNQRQELLPSEKAFAYRMQLEAIERQGATNCRTLIEVAKSNDESRRQIQRYIRLTYLIPDFITMIDDGDMPVMAGVELSYLSDEEQWIVYDYVSSKDDARIDISKAKAIRILSKDGSIDDNTLYDVFSKVIKPNQYIKLPTSRMSFYFEPTVTAKEMESEIIEALEFYRENRDNY